LPRRSCFESQASADGKAEPFRTSSGKATEREWISRIKVQLSRAERKVLAAGLLQRCGGKESPSASLPDIRARLTTPLKNSIKAIKAGQSVSSATCETTIKLKR